MHSDSKPRTFPLVPITNTNYFFKNTIKQKDTPWVRAYIPSFSLDWMILATLQTSENGDDNGKYI